MNKKIILTTVTTLLLCFNLQAQFSSIVELTNIDSDTGIKINGVGPGDLSGYDVSSAGDINGDGINDILISAINANNVVNIFDPGSVYVIFGTIHGFPSTLELSTLNGSNGFEIQGIDSYQHIGQSVSSAGDINHDGIDDLIIGSSTHRANDIFLSGSAYILFGSLNSFASSINLAELDGSNGFTINGLMAYNRLGNSVSNIGDINNDGNDDIIISAYSADSNGNESGTCYVLFGTNSGFNSNFNLANLNGTNGFVIHGLEAGNRLGVSTSGIGDFNGDGISDFILGTNYSNNKSYIVYGNSHFPESFDLTNINGFNGHIITGDSNNHLGQIVSKAGDLNADGLDDVMFIGNKINVVFGKNTFLDMSTDLSELNGYNGFFITSQYNFKSLSFAGDINGDKIDDIIVGVIYNFPENREHSGALLLYGSTSGFSPTIDLLDFNGKNGFLIKGDQNTHSHHNSAGNAVSNAGDLNGDGLDDVIIAANLSEIDQNRYGAGITYVLFGNDTILKNGFENK